MDCPQKPIRVFRVEHPESRTGPYIESWAGREQMKDEHNELCDTTHPGGYQILPDYWEMDTSPYLYGCPSLEDLREWFSGYWDELMAAGFAIREYVTSHYYRATFGIPQVAFIPEERP